MTLHSKLIPMILTGCLLAVILTSCRSHVQKADDAFDLVKKERMMSNDSNYVSQEIIQESMKTQIVKKIETPDEWTSFKIEAEKKIRLNEKKIKELKGLPYANANLLRKVKSIEKENNELRVSMDEYNEEVKAKWVMFKASMNHKINMIDIELNAIKSDNKK